MTTIAPSQPIVMRVVTCACGKPAMTLGISADTVVRFVCADRGCRRENQVTVSR